MARIWKNIIKNDFMEKGIISFIENLNQVGVESSAVKTAYYSTKVVCSFKNNNDGSIRWIWPAYSRETDYFKFYHIASTKTKLLSLLTKWVIKIGLGNLFADGFFNIYINKESSNKLNYRWAYFLGTIGPNQKAILWYKESETKQAYFTKIAITKQAQHNIINEYSNILKFQNADFTLIDFPQASITDNNYITLSDVSKNTYRVNSISDLPVNALHEWLQQDIKTEVYFGSSFKSTIDEIVYGNSLKLLPNYSSNLLAKLKSLSQQFIQYKTLKVASAHGDFTPWNVLCSKNSFALIDFELATPLKTALFDLFHFVYQSNILIGNKGYAAIKKELEYICSLPEWQHFLVANNLDFKELELMYLIDNMYTHLQLYAKQPKWHTQIYWLLNTWNEALTYHLQQRKLKTNKLLFLSDLKDFLVDKSYAYLKHEQKDWLNIAENSDIDLCVNTATYDALINYFNTNSLIERYHVKHFSYLKQIEIHFTNNEILYIDLILAFKRKSILYLDADTILKSASLNIYQIKVAAPIYEFLYIYLFYILNLSKIPTKYVSQLINIFLSANVEEQNYLLNYLGINSTQLFLALENQKHPFRLVRNHIINTAENKSLNRVLNIAIYLFDSMHSFLQTDGYTITFSGVDGAGKSTIIENIKLILEKKYRKPIVVLRHRPSILPIISAWKYGKKNAEKISVEKLPRTGTNTNIFSSLARFSYYYLDYFIGQIYIYFKYTSRGYVVLYDRYYFDFINDAKRSNIILPEIVISSLYFFIIKPKFNFFLYAPTAIILNRKKELEPKTIQELNNKYLHLFNTFQNKYKSSSYDSIVNIDLNDTLSLIENKILQA